MKGEKENRKIGITITVAVVFSAALLLWMKLFFLHPLADEASAMHKKQLDPTEIIAIPYDLSRLIGYVSVVLVASIIAGGDFQRVRKIAQYSAVSFVYFIVSGASPYVNLFHTLWAAIYFSTLLWFDPPVFIRKPSSVGLTNITLLDHMKERLVRRSSSSSPQSLLASITTQSTIAVSIPAQILLLYDRGWQVQRWPVPLVLGSTIGWSIGVIVGTLMAVNLPSSNNNSKKQEDFR